jgi:lipoate-protein ligase A
MTAPVCRVLPFAIADGPHNMAADEGLLRSAARGVASLRFYGWTRPTISLGYFQPAARRLEDPLLRDLPFVRRPTGGDALVHDREITYCLAVPLPGPQREQGQPWLRMHAVLVAALADLGVTARLHAPSGDEGPFTGFLCFEHLTAGDVLVGTAKVVGSAQRKQRGAVMQHGGILLATSPHTPALPGIREMSGVAVDPAELRSSVVRLLDRQPGWRVEAGSWTKEEERLIEEMARDRYATDAWNRKR